MVWGLKKRNQKRRPEKGPLADIWMSAIPKRESYLIGLLVWFMTG